MDADEYRRMAEVESTHWWYASVRALLQQLLADKLPAGGRFLDVGGGTGATGSWMAEHGDLIVADIEPIAVRSYRDRHKVAGVVNADVNRLPFADQSFDAVMCITVLCHQAVPSPAHAVGELARVLRPGGVLCLQEPGVRRLWRAHDRITHTARRFSRRDLADLVVGAGLQLERSTGAHSFLIPPAAAKSVLERGESSSDLERNAGGLGGTLSAAAGVERRVLQRVDLPAGLSVHAIGRRASR
jgi:SAM-dependent methyltransferase